MHFFNSTNSDSNISSNSTSSGFNFDPFFDNNNINNTNNNNDDDDKRFSIVNLEKDVTEYMQYRAKYYFYNNKLKKSWILRRRRYKKQEKYYYNLYIHKMKYLEETYRRTNNYTKYHAQLEGLPSANAVSSFENNEIFNSISNSN